MNVTIKTQVGPYYNKSQLNELISRTGITIVTTQEIHKYPDSEYSKKKIYVLPDNFDSDKVYDMSELLHYVVVFFPDYS